LIKLEFLFKEILRKENSLQILLALNDSGLSFISGNKSIDKSREKEGRKEEKEAGK